MTQILQMYADFWVFKTVNSGSKNSLCCTSLQAKRSNPEIAETWHAMFLRRNTGLLRRFAPRNDGRAALSVKLCVRIENYELKNKKL